MVTSKERLKKETKKGIFALRFWVNLLTNCIQPTPRSPWRHPVVWSPWQQPWALEEKCMRDGRMWGKSYSELWRVYTVGLLCLGLCAENSRLGSLFHIHACVLTVAKAKPPGHTKLCHLRSADMKTKIFPTPHVLFFFLPDFTGDVVVSEMTSFSFVEIISAAKTVLIGLLGHLHDLSQEIWEQFYSSAHHRTQAASFLHVSLVVIVLEQTSTEVFARWMQWGVTFFLIKKRQGVQPR